MASTHKVSLKCVPYATELGNELWLGVLGLCCLSPSAPFCPCALLKPQPTLLKVDFRGIRNLAAAHHARTYTAGVLLRTPFNSTQGTSATDASHITQCAMHERSCGLRCRVANTSRARCSVRLLAPKLRRSCLTQQFAVCFDTFSLRLLRRSRHGAAPPPWLVGRSTFP